MPVRDEVMSPAQPLPVATRTTDAARYDATPALLEVRAVDLLYKTKSAPIQALKDVSLTVETGEFVAVLGPSGCGKSSLLKLVAGLLPPSAGQIVLDGRPVTKPRPTTGLMFQTPTLLPWKSVLSNVLVPIRAMAGDVETHREKAANLLDLVGLRGFAQNYPNELSGGMQQRVSLARALIHDPQILLMDEPFAALDAMTREQMAIALQRLWLKTRKSVLFITHNIQEAVFLADRVLMFSGRPGHVASEMKIEFSRPRDLDTFAHPRFVELCNELRRKFQVGTGET
ncbi:MAG TPA: ABC transporter ATP-binding protein [Stellaceae bacterium]|nr:ABC transporter ATP-binding protein [Stellaceae bacterium]